MFFSLLLAFNHSIAFQYVFVTTLMLIKLFVFIKSLCKTSFIVMRMVWAEKLLQIYQYLFLIWFNIYHGQ